LGRVLFTSKSEPAIDWPEIKSCFQEISTPARFHDLPVAPPATLAHEPTVADDQPVANDPLATSDLPVSHLGDPPEMLSLLAAIPSNQS